MLSRLLKERIYGLRVLYEPEDAEAFVDIILIHGLFGHAYRTWYQGDQKVFWPEKLLSDDFPRARIMTFGYDADVTNFFGAVGHGRLRDHAEGLLNDLVNRRSKIDPVRPLSMKCQCVSFNGKV